MSGLQQFRPIPTLWLDFVSGRGVDDAGASVRPIVGGRRTNPNLTDLLNTAAHHRVERLMLSGKFPSSGMGRPHWLLTETEGWQADARGHWIQDVRPPVGRFVRASDKIKVEVRTAGEWLGTDEIDPKALREALQLAETALHQEFGTPHLALNPTRTGFNLWTASLDTIAKKDPEKLHRYITPIEDDIADLVRSTSGQHRTEHFAAGPGRCSCGDCTPLITEKTIDRFVYADGRFAYASLCNELGSGPAQMLTGNQAEDYFADRFVKGRAKVEFTVPDGWDTVGLAPVARPDGQWHYPNRPGARHTSWVDAKELSLMRLHGWSINVLEGISFTKGRPLDLFASKLTKSRERLTGFEADPVVIDAAAGALRAVLLQAIGGLHSQGRDATIVVESAREIPPEYQASMRNYGDLFVYTKPFDESTKWPRFYHPEYSAQIWAGERARMIEGPTAKYTATAGVFAGQERNRFGALDLDPSTIIGINGDALYTTEIPQACLPVDYGGGDDGKVGRLRIKGIIDEQMPTPPTVDARNKLRRNAEAIGYDPATTTPTA